MTAMIRSFGAALVLALSGSLLAGCVDDTALPAIPEACHAPKPTLFVVSASWCGPCKSLHAMLDTDADVRARLTGYEVQIIDADLQPELKSKAQVSGYPTMFVIGAHCRTLGRTSGFRGPRAFTSWIDDMEEAARRQ